MTDRERELRDALQARAGAMRVGSPDESGLVRRIAAARRRRRQARLAGVAAALVLALGAASLVAADDPDRETVIAGPDPSSTTTILDPSTTTVETTPEVVPTLPVPGTPAVVPGTTVAPAPSTTAAPTRAPTTTAPPLPSVPDDAVWPAPGSTTTFSTVDRAVDDFARRFLGMATPQLAGLNVAGTTATMNVHPKPGASIVTVVSLRRVEGRGWVVLGSAAPAIAIDEPAAGATVASPLTVRGRAQVWEGHVDVEVRRDGAIAPIGKYFGTGASDQMAPYESTVAFPRPSVARGAIVVSTPNAEDGKQGPLAATVVRIRF